MNKIVGLLFCLQLACVPFAIGAVAPDAVPPQRVITVTGEAQVRVKPDRVIVRLGIDSQDRQLVEAKRKNDEVMKRLHEVFQELGLKEDQVQTNFIEIEPVYRRSPKGDESIFNGYAVRNSVAVMLKELSLFDRLLSGVLEAGVNRIDNVGFRTSELKRHRDTARRLAVKAALDKATTLAGELGRKVGRPITILEMSDRTLSPYRMREAATMQSQICVEPNTSNMVSQEGIALGKIGIDASVKVTFELE